MYQYKGVLQPNDVIHTLKQYDALIFPSHYDGEGCPGILVESLSASLPVIASDWKYNNELVTNGDNGFLCSTFDPNEYVEAIKVLLLNQYYVKNLKTLWHTATYAYNSPSRGTLQHLADDIENS